MNTMLRIQNFLTMKTREKIVFKVPIVIIIVILVNLLFVSKSDIQFIKLEDGLCTTRQRWSGGEGECKSKKLMNNNNMFPTSLNYGNNNNINNEKQNTTLIVVIISARHHFLHRRYIRETWGSEHACHNHNNNNNNSKPSTVICKIFFVLGMPTTIDDKNGQNNTKIIDESNMYQDIIHVPVLDIYTNLIYKVLLAFDYIDDKYNYTFVLKVDDDTYINLKLLIKDLLHPLHPIKKTLKGQIWETVPMRDEMHKNYISELYYPLKQLIPYPHGAHYLITNDFVKYIVQNEEMLAPSIIPPEYRGNLEDVRIGMWSFSIGMSYVHDIRFVESINCHYNAISISDVPLHLFKPIYNHLLQNNNNDVDNNNIISMCTNDLHEYAANEYLKLAKKYILEADNDVAAAAGKSELIIENKDTKHLYEKGGDALNNAAIHFAYVSKFKEAMASFEDAKKIYEIIGIENRRSASHNLEYFYKIASGENDCDLKCHEKLKFAIDKGLEEFARQISKP